MMEQFLSDIHYSLYIHYIYSFLKDSTIEEDCFGTYIKNAKFHSTVFLTKDKIVEFTIQQDSKTTYYLHFEFVHLSNALNLFNDFLTYLHHNQPIKVLICCSSALTSSYLVDGLKKYIETNHQNVTVDACSYNRVDEIKDNYDLILLAPQISYLSKRLPTHINSHIIPANLYATSNYRKIIDMILEVGHQ